MLTGTAVPVAVSLPQSSHVKVKELDIIDGDRFQLVRRRATLGTTAVSVWETDPRAHPALLERYLAGSLRGSIAPVYVGRNLCRATGRGALNVLRLGVSVSLVGFLALAPTGGWLRGVVARLGSSRRPPDGDT